MRIEIPLHPKQSAFARSLEKFDITGYGGAKGGGKSYGGRMVPIIECLSTPGLTAAIFRQSYPELEDNHIDPLFRAYPQLRPFYKADKHEIRIPSLDSVFKFRYCESLSDVEKHKGREYHRLIIEEAGDWPYEKAMRLYRYSCRSSIRGIRASAGFMFNWGGVGHAWLKRLFYEKKIHPHERMLSLNFILAKLEDNPSLMENDPGYATRLESEPNEALRRAHRDGDPNIVAGQYFEIVPDRHVIRPFIIPGHWNWGGAYDYGFNHPAFWALFAMDEDGNVTQTHEIVKAGLRIDEQAALIKAINDKLVKSGQKRPGLPVFEAGHDCWARKIAGMPTIAEDFLRHGVILRRANIDRKQGASQLRNYLAFGQKPNGELWGPRLRIFDTCQYTIDCLTRMVHNPDDPEDVKKVDSVDGDPGTGDDPYDGVRMFIMSRPPVTLKPEKPVKDRYQRARRKRASWQTV